MSAEPSQPGRTGSGRILAIDVARGVALLAMASYHFTWDLEFFGYITPGTTGMGGWKLYARCIASTFLVLVGVSLVLAHQGGVRWPKFWRRWLGIAAAAVPTGPASDWKRAYGEAMTGWQAPSDNIIGRRDPPAEQPGRAACSRRRAISGGRGRGSGSSRTARARRRAACRRSGISWRPGS